MFPDLNSLSYDFMLDAGGTICLMLGRGRREGRGLEGGHWGRAILVILILLKFENLFHFCKFMKHIIVLLKFENLLVFL